MPDDLDTADILYGAPAIADAMKMTPRQIYHLARHHGLPTFKIGARLCAKRSRIATWTVELDAPHVAKVAVRQGRPN